MHDSASHSSNLYSFVVTPSHVIPMLSISECLRTHSTTAAMHNSEDKYTKKIFTIFIVSPDEFASLTLHSNLRNSTI
jgi:hypothetical protein